jgi:hypothetical protein
VGWKALVCKLVGTQDVTMEVCEGLNTESSIEGDEEPVEGIIERSSGGLLEGSFLNIIIDDVMDGNCEVYTSDASDVEITVGS